MFEFTKRARVSDPGNSEPSPVIHVRSLPPHTLEIDLIRLLATYGKVREVAMMPQRRQALIEFESLAEAEAFVNECSQNPLRIGNVEIPVAFSVSKRIIQRAADKLASGEDLTQSTENHVLLFTIYNSQHPISIDAIKSITDPFARIVRIVMFRKSQIQQAMVEFRTIDEARLVKRNLNGADIYAGCCTLKVDYARPEHLHVTRNDQESWDFDVNPMCGEYGMPPATALVNPQACSLLGAYGDAIPPHFPNGAAGPPAYPPDRCLMAAPHFEPPHWFTSVVMIYKLNMDQVNCDRLFNLICPYGNVLRVKFLHSREGSAMVEMGDAHSVDRVIDNLSGIVLFGNRIVMQPSRQTEVIETGQAYKLPDGSPSFKDFSHCRNNRYLTPKFALKNRPFKPSKTLHYWNCPVKFTLENMGEICSQLGAPVPTKLLTYSRSTGRTSSGLVQWDCDEDALAALCIVNHYEIPNPDAPHPFILKLSFAVETIRE